MPFGKILRQLIDTVPGAVGAVFADWEGEAVDQASNNGDSYHIKFLGAHHGILLSSVNRISDQVEMGEPRYITIKTEKTDYYTTPIHDGYFVVLAVKSGNAPQGLAHFALKKAVKHIRDEMGF